MLWTTLHAGEMTVVHTGANWKFLAGRSEASSPDPASWRVQGFDDESWLERPATFYYGEAGYTGSLLSDMQGAYSSFFLRRRFAVEDPHGVNSLALRVVCDDGFVAWINGRYVTSVFAPAGATNYSSVASGVAQEPVAYGTYLLPAPADYLVAGTNVLAVQVFNVSLGSSDIVFDAELVAELSSVIPPMVAGVEPTPGLVESLDRVTVTFSEPVTGVKASDLMLNGAGAFEVLGTGEVYEFRFASPALGAVQVSWDPRNAIRTVAPPVRTIDPTSGGDELGL